MIPQILKILKSFDYYVKTLLGDLMYLNEFYTDLKSDVNFKDIKTDSKLICPGDIFIAIKGHSCDGHDFINDAINKQASFIISEKCIENVSNTKYKIVKNTRDELPKLLNFYYSLDNINLIGITGTDGKTTTATILYHILNYKNEAAYIGTNGIFYKNKIESVQNTTPNLNILHQKLFSFKKNDILHCSLEVSSEGILDNRINGLNFNAAIFTNLSHEHLNSHKTMRKYFLTKQKLFDSLSKNALAIVNIDDKYGKKIKSEANIITFGLNNGTYRAKNIHLTQNNSVFDLYYKSLFLTTIELPLFGIYNIYNALGAIVYAYETGISLSIIKNQLKSLIKIDGRFEVYEHLNKSFIIDFAHTPNALKNLLSNLIYIRNQKIILVMGCAGEKDRSKRKEMSKIACDLADIVIFTSEDPKNENLLSIFHDMTSRLKKNNYYMCIDRKEAIKLACKISNSNDLVVITGKGNEKYETIKGIKFKHNDLEEIKKYSI